MNNDPWEEIEEDRREEEEEALHNPPSDSKISAIQPQSLEEEIAYWQDN